MPIRRNISVLKRSVSAKAVMRFPRSFVFGTMRPVTPPLTACQPKRKRAIILDRDGTIVRDHHYLDDPRLLQFLPGAAAALRQFRQLGHPIIVVTNQSGVGRGHLTLERMHEINERFVRMVEEIGAGVDRLYSCPHKPEDDCECRKPKTKLVLDGAAAVGFEPAHSVVIGDKSSDIALGRNLQAVTMLVSNDGRARDGDWVEPDYVIRDLLEAVRIVANLETVARDGAGDAVRG
jgi:D-glycero-D-manno-heptose 1,7-bisphosphate phosphatase